MNVVHKLVRREKKKTAKEMAVEVESVKLTDEEWTRIQRSIDAGEAAYNYLSLKEQENMIGFLKVAFPDEKIETVDDGRNFIKSVVKNKTIQQIEDNFKEAERLMGLGKTVLKTNEKLGSRFDGIIIKALEKLGRGKVQLERVPTSDDAANVENMVKEARDAFFDGQTAFQET